MCRNILIWMIFAFVMTFSTSIQGQVGPPRYASFQSGTEGWTVYTGQPLGEELTHVPSGGVLNSGFVKTEDLSNGFLYFRAPSQESGKSWTGNYLNGVLSFFLKNLYPSNLGAYPNPYKQPLVKITGQGGTAYYSPTTGGAGANWTLNVALLTASSDWCVVFSGESVTLPCSDQSALNRQDAFKTILSGVTQVEILADWGWGFYGKGICGDTLNTWTCDHDITGLDEVYLIGGIGQYGSKSIIRQQLIELRLTISDAWQRDKLDTAIRNIDLSLNQQYWKDGDHLWPATGTMVFDDERYAVTALSQILAYDKATIPQDKTRGFINQLMAVDRTLAQTAVNEAPDGSAKRKAQDQIDQGTAKEKRGMYESALNQYKSAWSLVQPQ